MHIYLMVLIISSITALGNVLLKKFQQEVKETFFTLCLYNLINAITASVYFFVINRFNINMNVPTLIFSCICAVIVTSNIIFNMFAMTKVSLVIISIITTAGTIVGTSLFGKVFLNERISIKLMTSIILVITAVSLPFIKEKLTGSNSSKTIVNSKTLFICICLFVVSSLSVIINKMYVNNTEVCDSNSYFFMLNFILIIVIIPILAIYSHKNKLSLRKVITSFTPKQTSYIVVRTLSSNVGAMITMIVLVNMNVSLYSVLTSSLALIANALASRYYFKEKLPAENKIAIVLAILAVCLAN